LKTKPKITVLIPARSGSKRIKDKNIKKLNGKPLIWYSIEVAKKLKSNYIIVSTDSKKYAKIASKFGIKIFYLRPKKISIDQSSDLELFKYNEKWMNKNLNYKNDIYVHLRPTHPFRKVSDIKKMINILIKKFKKIDSVRTISEVNHPLEKTYKIKKNLLINKYGISRKYKNKDYLCNLGSNSLSKTYEATGNIDVFKASLLKRNTVSGNKIYGYITKSGKENDIDTLEDFLNLNR
jgi:CMP-N-acetylneuraminic acid synthetase